MRSGIKHSLYFVSIYWGTGTNLEKWAVMYLYVRCINFTFCFEDVSTGFDNDPRVWLYIYCFTLLHNIQQTKRNTRPIKAIPHLRNSSTISRNEGNIVTHSKHMYDCSPVIHMSCIRLFCNNGLDIMFVNWKINMTVLLQVYWNKR